MFEAGACAADALNLLIRDHAAVGGVAFRLHIGASTVLHLDCLNHYRLPAERRIANDHLSLSIRLANCVRFF